MSERIGVGMVDNSGLYYGYRIYGPYYRQDGSAHVILMKDEVHRALSYPRYLTEVVLGRQLTENEEVHHVDGDRTNNNIENLEVLSKEDQRVSKIKAGVAELADALDLSPSVARHVGSNPTLGTNYNKEQVMFCDFPECRLLGTHNYGLHWLCCDHVDSMISGMVALSLENEEPTEHSTGEFVAHMITTLKEQYVS